MVGLSKLILIPTNEATRLKVLARCRILDTAPEKFFDDLAMIASQVMDCPIAAIGFVDKDRVWYKAERGLHFQEFPRPSSMSAYLVGSAERLVIPDIDADDFAREIFARNYPSGLRFFAGFPLISSSGHVLGALAVMDYKPRTPTNAQLDSFEALAGLVVAELEYRRRQSEQDRVADARKSLPDLSEGEIRILHTLVDNMPDLIYIKNREGRYVLDNVAHRRFLGVSRLEDVVGRTVADFFPPALAEEYREDDQKVMHSGQPLLDHAEPIVDPGGEPREVSTSKIPLYDAAGEIEGILCIGRDIAYTKEAELALAQERYQLHALMDNIPDNIYFKDHEGRFTRVNNSLAQWFGLNSPEEAIGKSDFDFFTEEHAAQAHEDEQRIMHTGRPIIAKEERETWPDGHTTWVSTTKVPLRDREGNVVGSFGISRDITQLKQATLELAERDARTREEMELARAIHKALLPVEAPRVPGLDFGLRFVPSGDIGGDFVNFIRLPYPNRIGVAFADITGHGVGAALLSSMLKVLVDEVTRSGLSQSGCFKVLNRRLYQEYPAGNFASSFYAVFDTANRTMTYVKASQEPVILLRPGAETRVFTGGGPALGLLAPDAFDEAEYEQQTVQLEPGDTVFFFTDGLIEFSDNERTRSIPRELLISWLEEDMVLDPQELVDSIYERAMTFTGRTKPTDDVATLAVRVAGSQNVKGMR